ncbi:MAG: type II toxin-antitoxin system Phd/YefM family antitoxin [Veillonella sp.]|nr:type II toxin-antitoxin system Phd/YefM family antitoxin [Veillonella sp.]
MISIRPVSDLRNKFSEIEKQILETNEPVFLTKNGYGTMVLMSIEQYDEWYAYANRKIQESLEALEQPLRHTHEEVFSGAKEIIDNAQRRKLKEKG